MRARYDKKGVEKLTNHTKFVESSKILQDILCSKENVNKKIYIEIGMGKGDFISNKAYADKDNIYIGVEISLPILSLATKKIDRFEEEKKVVLDNLILMSFDAINISEFFKANQIEKIYLNFSDPWPKKRHEKRRLTSYNFLKEYTKVLKNNGLIEFKTDNRGLFEFSLVSIQNFGMKFIEVYLDLHKVDIENVVTEYEEKFSKLGPIYKLVVENICVSIEDKNKEI